MSKIDNSLWQQINEMFASSNRKIDINPEEQQAGVKVLDTLQITSKSVLGVEVKGGSASRTPQQIAIDNELVKSGGLDTVGRNAENARVGRIDTVKVVHVDNNGNISKIIDY